MIKSCVSSEGKVAYDFPKLMISKKSGAVVLMLSYKGDGITLTGGNIGTYYKSLCDVTVMEDFHGKVTIENE